NRRTCRASRSATSRPHGVARLAVHSATSTKVTPTRGVHVNERRAFSSRTIAEVQGGRCRPTLICHSKEKIMANTNQNPNNPNNQNPNNPNQSQNQDPTRKQAPGYDDKQGQQGQRRDNMDVERNTDKTRQTPIDNE